MFLLEDGVEFIRACIKAIRFKFKSHGGYKSEFNFLILESYAWPEISVIILANSYNLIRNLTMLIRSLTKFSLKSLLEKSKVNEEELLNTLFEKHRLIAKENFDHDPIFLDSNTTLGFDYNLYRDTGESKLWNKIDEKDLISPFIEWSIKPGYIDKLLPRLRES